MPVKVTGPRGGIIGRRIPAGKLPALVPGWLRRFKHITLAAAPAVLLTPRQRIVKWARWGVANAAAIHYTEAAERSAWLHATPPNRLPLSTDCSGFTTLCYRLAGLPDPNGLGYKTLGYTGTLLDYAQQHGRILTDISKALPGDLIVYGPGTGWHVAIVVQAGRDPLTASHGQESEPAYVRVSQDGRQPQRVCRYLP